MRWPSERFFRKNLSIAGALCLAWLVYRVGTARIPKWQDWFAVIGIVVVLFNAWMTADRVDELEHAAKDPEALGKRDGH